jgi:hypothetical protein
VSNAHVGVIGACPRPHRLTGVETLLNGHAIDDGLIRQAAATAKPLSALFLSKAAACRGVAGKEGMARPFPLGPTPVTRPAGGGGSGVRADASAGVIGSGPDAPRVGLDSVS